MNPSDSLALLESVEAALAEGRAPRARKPLRDAARTLFDGGQPQHAIRAMHLLSRLELRSGDTRCALNAVRAALRYSRAAEAGERDSLQLMARVLRTAGEHSRAVDAARRALKAAEREGQGGVEARLCLAETEARAHQFAVAAETAEAALAGARSVPAGLAAKAERVAAEILLQSGCPGAAEKLLSAAFKRSPEAPEQVCILMDRGSARLMLGRPDQASRDFRAAVRRAKELKDPRHEAQALAALGSVERKRAEDERNTARAGRAQSALDRAARIAKRLKDPYLTESLEALQKAAGRAGPVEDPQAAARRLVALAHETTSTLLVDACVQEVERLSRVPQGEHAYAAGPLPIRFNPA